MKEGKFYKFTAILVILIFTLAPVAFAAQITDSTAFGLNEIPNYTKDKYTDQTTFQVIISSTEEVSLEEVFFKIAIYNSRFSFAQDICISSSCSAAENPNTYLCECTTAWAPENTINVIFEYEVNGNVQSSDSITVYPDYLPPEIEEASIVQVGEITSIQYKVKDSACDNCNNKCSGLKELVITDEDGQVASLELEPDCTIISTNNFSYNKEGEHEFLIILRDAMWESIDDDDKHSDNVMIYFESDFSVPELGELSVKKDGVEVFYISDSDLIVDLYVNITDPKLDKISATLSDIGTNTNLINVDASSYCTLINDIYECNFLNKKITAEQAEISFTFTATDEVGNSNEKVLTKSFSLDNSKPTVTAIETLNKDAITSYINQDNNTIIMKIDESDSGFNNKNIYLNLANLGNSNNVQADRCEEGWICYWDNIVVNNVNNNQLVTVSRIGSSSDDAGNMFTENIGAVNFKVDNEAPEILEIDVAAIGAFGERYYYQSGDILKIRALVDYKGGSPINTVKADISNFFNSDTILDGTCEELFIEGQDNLFLCEWTTQPIKSGEYNAEFEITVYDAAGNSASAKKEIPVYGIISDQPDNFNVVFEKEDLIPKKINRLTASIMPNPPGYKIMVPFKLTGGGSNIEVLHYVVDSCSIGGDENVFDQVFRDEINPTPTPIPTFKTVTQAGDQNFLELTLGRFSGDDINLLNDFSNNCTISIYQKYGNKVYDNPEIETLEFDLEVVGSALPTEPGQQILDLIDDAKHSTMVTSKFIEKGSKWSKKLEEICQYGTMLAGVWNTFALIESVGVGLKKAKQDVIGKAVFAIGCYGYEGFGAIFAKLYYGGKNIQLPSGNVMTGKAFSLGNCNTKGGEGTKWTDGASGLGEGRKIADNPTMIKDALGEWEGAFGGEGSFPGIRNICGFISCEYGTEISEKINQYTGGTIFQNSTKLRKGVKDFNEDIMQNGSMGSISTEKAQITPKNSIIMSAVTFCIPGIFYNLDKYRQIQCQYMMCLKDTALAGGPIYMCKAKRAQAQCLVIFGEISETVGILKIIKRVGQQATTSLADLLPNLLKLVIDKAICDMDKADEGPGEFLVPLFCDLPRAYYNIKDSIDRLKGIGTYGKKETWQLNGENGGDICSQVKADELIGWSDEEENNQTTPSHSSDQDVHDTTTSSTTTTTTAVNP